MNTPVSFPIAKLLKEKGFDSYTPLKYFSKKPSGYNIINWSENTPYSCEDIYSQLSLGYNKQTYFTWAPTISEVVMWLYEKHGIWINVSITIQKEYFYNCTDITGKKDPTKNNYPSVISKSGNYYKSPTEAYEAAIEYILNNLI